MNNNELQLFPTEETENQPILFEGKYIRHEWVKEDGDWFFSVADVVEVLTDSLNPGDYIKKMKKRDPELAKGWGQIVPPPSDIMFVQVCKCVGMKGEIGKNKTRWFSLRQ